MNSSDKSKRKSRLTLRPGAAVYGALFLYALLMTQLLKNPASAVFFWFIVIILSVSFAAVPTGHARMPRKNAIIACKGIPNQSKAGTHGMSHMGAGFVCMGLFPRPRAGKIIQ